MAYSLLGIFDVYIPLIYSEGKNNALRRLRGEIDSRLVPTLILKSGGRSIKGVASLLKVIGFASILSKYINIM
jgi:hypothetical protein